MSDGPWTDAENRLIVTDCFAMPAADVAGQPCNKAEHNRELQARIDRNRSSIEFKHQNARLDLVVLGALGHLCFCASGGALRFHLQIMPDKPPQRRDHHPPRHPQTGPGVRWHKDRPETGNDSFRFKPASAVAKAKGQTTPVLTRA